MGVPCDDRMYFDVHVSTYAGCVLIPKYWLVTYLVSIAVGMLVDNGR